MALFLLTLASLRNDNSSERKNSASVVSTRTENFLRHK